MAANTLQSSVTTNYLKICSDLGCRPIPELLTSLNSNLRKLSIATDDLQDGQIISMCAILPLSSCEELTMQYLDLPVNSWVAISDACCKTRSLSKLIFKQCKVKAGQSLKSFGRALSMTNLHTLEVFDFKFGDELIFELVEGPLLKSDKLNTLRLCGCNISDEGASAIAKTLEFVGMMSGVKTLELSNNKVGDIGAHAIASMLCNDSSSSVPLLSLELDSNMISEVGGVELCKAAKGALVLQRLNLSHNSIGDATVVEMADAIRFNAGTLREVLLSGARAKEESIAYLLRASSRSTALQLLDIRGLPLSLDTVSHASALLKQTNSLHALMLEVSSREAAESLARESRGFRNHIQLTVGGPIPLGLLSQMGEVIGASTVRIQNSGSMVPESSIVRAWIEDSVKSTQQYHGSNSSSTLNSNLFPSSHPNPSDRLPCPPPLPSSFDSFPVSPMSSINRAPSPSIPAPASAASIFTIPSPASPPIASPSLPSTSQPTTPRTSMRGVEGSALSGSASANNPGINNNNNSNNHNNNHNNNQSNTNSNSNNNSGSNRNHEASFINMGHAGAAAVSSAVSSTVSSVVRNFSGPSRF
mmetsp:Transcript_3881/g.6828  ORF Transcript_3881/g.6828 Transcript_3881/m.6828 type:complete len:588 (-) Transcript_3881:222-1985(-)